AGNGQAGLLRRQKYRGEEIGTPGNLGSVTAQPLHNYQTQVVGEGEGEIGGSILMISNLPDLEMCEIVCGYFALYNGFRRFVKKRPLNEEERRVRNHSGLPSPQGLRVRDHAGQNSDTSTAQPLCDPSQHAFAGRCQDWLGTGPPNYERPCPNIEFTVPGVPKEFEISRPSPHARIKKVAATNMLYRINLLEFSSYLHAFMALYCSDAKWVLQKL
ncbi:hypothetical protein B0H14DRAFT_2621367, partial [Mycena olivaceomarginata]